MIIVLLVGCDFKQQESPPTQIIVIPTNTLGPIVSFTPKFTATLIPTVTLIPSITPTPSVTPPPPTETPAPTLTPTPAISGSVNFTSPTANLRAGPGQNFQVLRALRSGTSVIVLGLNDGKDWYNVRLEDGTEGWLSVALVTVPNASTVAILTTAILTQRAQTAVAPVSGGTAAGTGEAVIGTPIPPGSKPRNAVLAYCDNPGNGEPRKTLPNGSSVIIYWSWFAKTPEQLSDHIEQAEYEVKVDGQPLSNWRNFKSDVVKSSRDGNYYVYWYVPIGSPQPGEHTVDYKVTWKQQITDGFKTFGPGGEEVDNTGSCVFTIK
jgi:uncharacterized protein YraI